ncbi:hypothetical protein JG687_00002243 [Phytophthora cactorum]|uniref:Uncharacterized protein n=2 Tax=Phytophthora TaxID=4783 RepID=A0A329SAD1_9STRA|nr:hypothetical protein Pcac1_g28161 [Phytophthora cactorum]KAG6973774.1 hypothetical protein JG688_00003378 [Phytophthora aleatoria]KAG2833803.1 hypothetical protein PC112_g6334 [Phytophthora cactorum]KAG2836263.1 hypothetical protein PC111_g5114 [Phytophthora cactorum]KAG2861943.1 hypothetical protein PC113_g6760 [Phytophthora cactorum]
MTSTFDPHAFAVAIELTDQLSSDGAFVDEQDNDKSDGFIHISCDNVGSDPALDSDGVQVFREAIPDSVCMDTPVLSAAAYTKEATIVHGLKSSSSWWSLIEHMVEVSAEDLLAMNW